MTVTSSKPPAAQIDGIPLLDRYRRLSFEFQLPPEPYSLSKIDPEALAAQWADANIDFVYVQAKHNQGETFYDTEVGYKFPGLGSRDFLAEIIEAARKYDILIGCYFNFSRDRLMYDKRPKWRQLWQDGSPRGLKEQLNPDWDNMCHNSPYRYYILDLLHEITTKYDIYGYWMDRLDWGGVFPDTFSCVCDYCQTKYLSETGRHIPTAVNWDDPNWRGFLDWRMQCIYRYMVEIRKTIKNAKPHVGMSLNYYSPLDMFGTWSHGQDPELVCDQVDNLTPEIHFEREGYIAFSAFGRFNRAASQGKPFDLDIFRHSGEVDYITKPVTQMKAEAYTALANGGAVLIDDQIWAEGVTDDNAYHVIREVFEGTKDREPYVKNATPVKYGALLYSKKSRLLYGRSEPQKYQLSYLGTYKALLDEQWPFEVLTDRQIRPEVLADYAVVVLPDAACLSDGEIDTIREYVRGGGNVVATHKTSMMDENGLSRGNFGLSDVFGVDYVDLPPLTFTYLRADEEDEISIGVPPGIPLGHRDYQLLVRPTSSDRRAPAKIVFSREEVNRVSHYCDPPFEQASEYPAVVAGEYGKGRVVYIPGRPGGLYARWGQPEYKVLLNSAVAWVGARQETPFEVDAPMSVEATMYRQEAENRVIVHLVNFQADPGRNIDLPTDNFMG